MPILYFGNLDEFSHSSLRIITVGYNPSKSEFPEPAETSRFPRNLRRGDSIQTYTNALNGYFEKNPYEDWFYHYEKLLSGLGATYGGKMQSAAMGVAAAPNYVIHTDLCSPLATDPTWGSLPAKARRDLQERGPNIWRSLVADCLKPNIILVSISPPYIEREIAPLDRWGEFKTINQTANQRPRKKPYTVKTCVVTLHDEKAVVVYGPLIRVPFNVFCSAEIGRQVKDSYQRLLSRAPISRL